MDKTIKILAAVAIITFAVQSFSNNKADVDLWGNVGFVTALPWSPEFHRTNTFSFTEPDHLWINHEWLSEYILHKTHAMLGNQGLLALKIILGLITFAVINITMRKQCQSGLLRFLLLMLAISTAGYGFSIRPHLFTYLMIAVFLLILRSSGTNKYFLLPLLPLLGLAWTNLHGAFFIGIILVSIFTFMESTKLILNGRLKEDSRYAATLAAVLILLIAVSLINPYGLNLWSFIIDSAKISRPYLSEWAPFNPVADFTDHTDFIALSIITFTALFASGKPKDFTWISILVLTFASAMILRRNIPVFAIVACCVIPEHLESAAGKSLDKITAAISKPVSIILLSAFICISAWYTVNFNKSNPFQIEVPRDKFPAEIVSFIKENKIKGNMLVFFDWAELVIWHLKPGCRVFLDGRFTDAYSHKTVTDYLAFLYFADNWRNTLRDYPVDMLLLHKDSDVYKEIPYLANWKLVCEDKIAGLFLNTNIHSNTISTLRPHHPGEANTAILFP